MNSVQLEQLERLFEEQFIKRYGKETNIKWNGSPSKDVSSLIIKCDGETFILTEQRKEGLTEKVLLKHGVNEYIYPKYLEAEVHIADIIGEKRWALLQKDTHSGQPKQ